MMAEAKQMVGGTRAISFRPVTVADFPMLREWLEQPHMREWWGDPEEELGFIRGMVEGRDTTRPYIFSVDGEPVGYIQVWFIADNRVEPWISTEPWIMKVPDDAVGVDLSIGRSELLSQGIGSKVLRTFALDLASQGHQTIIIDPDPDNKRAVRAYEKAGFRTIPHLKGKTPGVHLMQFDFEQHETN